MLSSSSDSCQENHADGLELFFCLWWIFVFFRRKKMNFTWMDLMANTIDITRLIMIYLGNY